MIKLNKSLCLLLSVIILITSLPIIVGAEISDYDVEYNISEGNVSISTAGNYYITGTSTTNTVTISGDAEISLTIDNLSITSSSSAPIDIINTGTTTIILEGTSTLTQNSTDNACIQMSGDDDVDLIIDGDGTLTVNANNSNTNGGAGIGTAKVASGSAVTSVGGTITINSGTITVNHNGTGAAIGTGVNLNTDKIVDNNMTINITGGTITVSHRSGAGIGGGARMDGGTINISGGTIATSQTTSASASYCGAGIGGGTYYSASGAGGGAGNITITGGTLNCNETYAEGIGRGVLATSLAAKTGTLIIDGDAVINATIVGEDDESITATWNATINGTVYSTVETFTVTFIDEDGTVSTKNIEQYTAMSEPTDIAKAGYKVEGYYTDNIYETKFEFTTTITADTTIYVQWEVDEDTIAYVDSLAELTSALADTNKSVIIIQGDITLTSDITISHDVTIYSDGDYTIGTNASGYNFIIANGVNVVLGVENDENTGILTITLGDGSYSDPAIMVGTSSGSSATLIMYDGISIADDTGISIWGTFTMNGGEITGNTAKQFGGVYLQPYSTFIMNDGLIEENCTLANGGGVAANGNGTGTGTTTITLNGGTITGNTVSGTGDGYAIRVIGATIKLNISENMVITTDVNTKNQFSWGGTETNISVSAKVTYDAGDGEGAVNDSNIYSYAVTKGSYTATVLSGSTLTKTGYTFKEWNTQADGTGTSYSSGDTLTAYASITLYAIYEIDTYTVTYMNGTESYLTESVDYNNTVTKPTDPTNTDATQVFGGWYTESGFTGSAYDFDSQVTANITLYAKWLTGYTVTFVNADNNSTYDTQGIVENEKATDITNPTRTGYTFVDWYSDEDCTTEFDFATLIEADTTVYGKWTANTYTLSFDTDDTSSITVTYDTEIGTLPTPTKENYNFGGWYIGDDEITSTTVWDYTESKEATAQWEKSNIQIVYNETELQDAIADTTVTDIVVGGSFTITEDITFDRAVTLYSNGDYTIDNGDTGYRFKIVGATVNFGQEDRSAGYEDYTLTINLGNSTAGVGVVASIGSILNVYDGMYFTGERGIGIGSVGAVINMYGGIISGVSTTTNGGGVYVSNGIFNMYGGTISDNSATNGGGVYITGTNSTFNMYGGTISGNTATTTGGGVYVNTSATFNMYGGTISGNTATTTGGGVYANSGTFTLTDGSITYNKANGGVGGGVYVNNSTFTMDGGEVSYNSATGNGGGVVGGNASEIELNDGVIYENNSDSSGTAIRASGSTSLTINQDMLVYDDDISDDDNLISIVTTGDVSIMAVVTYEANGGTVVNPQVAIVKSVTELTLFSDTVSECTLTAPNQGDEILIFVGWNTKADGTGTTYLPGDTMEYYTSTTLYAIWHSENFTLTLDADGGTLTDETIQIKYNTGFGDLETPTKEGYIFINWEIDGEAVTAETIWTYSTEQTAVAVYENATDTVFAVVNSNGVASTTAADTYTALELDEAFSSGETLVLQRDFTLPPGDYVITNGTKIIIPRSSTDDGPDDYGDAYSMNDMSSWNTSTDGDSMLYDEDKYKPDIYGYDGDTSSGVENYAYMTLTMATGASIDIGSGTDTYSGDEFHDGVLIVNATVTYLGAGATGFAYGTYGLIVMEEGSTITVKSDGNLEVYGYIQNEDEWTSSSELDNSGQVIAEPGSLVGELLEYSDYKGGNISVDITDYVVPISQYYVQNIQVEFEIQSGAQCIGHYFIQIAVSIFNTTEYRQNYCNYIIGDTIPDNIDGKTQNNKLTSVFWLESGTITRTYTPPSGQTSSTFYTERHTITFDIYGTLTTGGIYEKIYWQSTFGGSSYFVEFISGFERPYPVNSDVILNINGDSVFNIDNVLKVLPGAQIYIAEDATVNIKDDGDTTSANDFDVGIGGLYLYTVEDYTGLFPNGTTNYNLSYQYGKYSQTVPTETTIQVDGTIIIDGGGLYVSGDAYNPDNDDDYTLDEYLEGDGNGVEVFLEGYTDDDDVWNDPTITFGEEGSIVYEDVINWVTYADNGYKFLSAAGVSVDEDYEDYDEYVSYTGGYPEYITRVRYEFLNYENDEDEFITIVGSYGKSSEVEYITYSDFGFPLYTITYYTMIGVTSADDSDSYTDPSFWHAIDAVNEAPENGQEIFIGWNTDSNATSETTTGWYEIEDEVLMIEHLDLYAIWENPDFYVPETDLDLDILPWLYVVITPIMLFTFRTSARKRRKVHRRYRN